MGDFDVEPGRVVDLSSAVYGVSVTVTDGRRDAAGAAPGASAFGSAAAGPAAASALGSAVDEARSAAETLVMALEDDVDALQQAAGTYAGMDAEAAARLDDTVRGPR